MPGVEDVVGGFGAFGEFEDLEEAGFDVVGGDAEGVGDLHHYPAFLGASGADEDAFYAVEDSADDSHFVAFFKHCFFYSEAGDLVLVCAGDNLKGVHCGLGEGEAAARLGVAGVVDEVEGGVVGSEEFDLALFGGFEEEVLVEEGACYSFGLAGAGDGIEESGGEDLEGGGVAGVVVLYDFLGGVVGPLAESVAGHYVPGKGIFLWCGHISPSAGCGNRLIM